MEYIKAKIDREVRYNEAVMENEKLKLFYQIRIEYTLVYLLSYLWNKNIESLTIDKKEFVFKTIDKPTIGQIISICKELDIEKEFFGQNAVNSAIDEYRVIRNEKLGHGYVFPSELGEFLEILRKLYDKLITALKHSIFSNECDLVKVLKFENNKFQGTAFKANGADFVPWICPKEVCDFEIGSLYISAGGKYFRISPFIELENPNQAYSYYCVEDRLIGKLRYNGVFETSVSKKIKEWDELCVLELENDGIRRRSINGTVMNVFQNNYTKYIDIGIKKKIKTFLTQKSSVCLTVWGHGGVGKTATVQSLCEDLSNESTKSFDYILFFSAKDIRYDYFTGEIKEIDEKIETLEAITQQINLIISGEAKNSKENILDYQGKLLLVIDDFETISADEREKISDFIKDLNINQHKVIITTRLFNLEISGDKITTNELTESETSKFLVKVIENELQELNTDLVRRELIKDENLKKVYQVTSGRPLFIFQFCITLAQQGSIQNALHFNISESDTAITFLYGRVYKSLRKTAKDIFVVISLLAKPNDLGGVIDKIRYILNLEHDEDTFTEGVSELVKFKIIKVDEENKFFEVYSKEVLQIMNNYFNQLGSQAKGVYTQRYQQVNRDRSLDTEQSLLLDANSSRLAKNEEEVISKYRQILNRTSSPEKVKLEAILNLTAYLIDRGRRDIALRYFNEFNHMFPESPLFAKMYSTYLWANGTKEQKNKAIDVLLQFTATNFSTTDAGLEVAGALLMYRCMMLQNDWNELLEKRNFNEIKNSDFSREIEDLILTCWHIHNNQGVKLFNYIATAKRLSEYPSGVKQNVISGLYQFIEICLKIKKPELANDICEYILYFGPPTFQKQFKYKQDKINYLIYKKSNPRGNHTKSKSQKKPQKKSNESSANTVLGDKLKEAFKKNK